MKDMHSFISFQEINNVILVARITGRPKYDIMFPQNVMSLFLQRNITYKFDDIVTYNLSLHKVLI